MQLKGKRIVIFLIAFYCGFLSFCGASSAAELKKIYSRGYLTIAVKDNLRPLGFRDAQGNLQGLEIDIAKRLAQDLLGKPEKVKLQPTENSGRLAAVLEDRVDLAIANFTATESRARLVSFSLPYYFDGTALITKNVALQKLGDVVRSKIAVINGSSTIASVRYLLPQAQLVGVNSYQAGQLLLEANSTVAFAGDASVLTGWKQQDNRYRLLPTLIGAEPLAVVMPKGLQYDDLRRQVSNAIARYVSDGWLEARVNYWGLPNSTSLRGGKIEQDAG